MAGRCVIIDPERRDLLFCVNDNTTPQEHHTSATQQLGEENEEDEKIPPF